MYFKKALLFANCCLSLTVSTILQNGQVRETNYPNTSIDASTYHFQSFPPNSTELSYKGRWDSKYISWWSAPGLKFGFTGNQVAITFGPLTSNGVLIAHRLSGQDWQFTNITASATHLLISPSTPGINQTTPITPQTFELRVTNWAYGVQISSIHLSPNSTLIHLPPSSRSIEVIGDSLSSGDFATLEGLSSYAYGLAAGLGDTEYSLTAYPGICAYDKECWGNPRGMFHQWFYTSDTSWRAQQMYGEKPELWDFSRQKAPGVVLVNLGTNDANAANGVSGEAYVEACRLLIMGVHAVWPGAKVVLISLWNGFYPIGNSYAQTGAWYEEIQSLHTYFNSPTYLANPILYNHTSNSTYIRESSERSERNNASNASKPSEPNNASERSNASGSGIVSGNMSNNATQPFVYYFNTTGILQHNDISPQWHPTDVGHVKLASHLMQFFKWQFGWEFAATGPEVASGVEYWNDEGGY